MLLLEAEEAQWCACITHRKAAGSSQTDWGPWQVCLPLNPPLLMQCSAAYKECVWHCFQPLSKHFPSYGGEGPRFLFSLRREM